MKTRTLLTAALFVASGLTTQAQVVDFSTVTQPTGPQPHRVAFGDITADSLLDLVTFNVGDVGLSLFRNDFTDFTYLRDPNGFVNPLRVFLTDFDLDGRADYIVGEPGGGAVKQANGDGDPYGASVGFSSGGNLSLGDLNSDGFVDIVGEDGTVWRNDGNMQITSIWGFAIGTQSLGSRVADVDLNGNLDVIIHDETMGIGDTIYVSLGNGDGTYADPSTMLNTGELDSIQVVDVSGDGYPDIVGYSSERNVLEVRLNDTLGGFAAPQTLATGAIPRDMVIGQFASGLPTIALLCTDGTLRFWINDTTGVFTGPAQVNVGVGAVSMTAIDFNFDGKDDLAVVNATDNTVKILTNTTPDTVLVSGTVIFEGRDDGAAEPAVTLRAFDSEGVEVALTANPDRTFSAFLPRGNWSIRARSPHYLSEVVAVNTTAGMPVSGVGITLRAGDANLDNVVDIDDLLLLIAYYNRVGFPNYLPAADFNGDFRNDITDLLLLIGNYNEMGD